MASPKSSSFFAKTRAKIARRLRELRTSRRWTQAELADQLELSQGRLSEIERGDGSLTAEQFLHVLRLFNETPASFVDETSDRTLALQNALVRLGAVHLHENDSIPPARVDSPTDLVREALIDGSPRLVTALAPILLKHADEINIRRLHSQLDQAGFGQRLPWLIENTLHGLDLVRSSGRDSAHWSSVHRGVAPLRMFLEFADDRRRPSDSELPDVIDAAIRSKRTAEAVQRAGSEISRRWHVVSALQPADFEDAIRSALAPDR